MCGTFKFTTEVLQPSWNASNIGLGVCGRMVGLHVLIRQNTMSYKNSLLACGEKLNLANFFCAIHWCEPWRNFSWQKFPDIRYYVWI